VLQQAGVKHITVFEARDRVGGRMFTVRDVFSADVELGAGWIQGAH
jgi:monoamine oxidase